MKMMKNVLLLMTFFAAACQLDPAGMDESTDLNGNVNVPSDFDFATSGSYAVNIRVQDNTGEPIKSVRIDILANLGQGKELIRSIASNSDGSVLADIEIPTYVDSIYLHTDFIGLVQDVRLPLSSSTVRYVYNSSNVLKTTEFFVDEPVEIKYGSTIIRTLSSFDSQGFPMNLEPEDDPIDAVMLKDINASLPETKPVPTYHPEYLASGTETDVILEEKAEVWVTFVHEGAGYTNSLGFYTYQKGDEPKNKNAIDTIHVVFPNASFEGSGGGLNAGNKVKIGTFPANTVIGWVCISGGFQKNTITTGYALYFSNPEFNPEPSAELRQHNVLLYDSNRGKVLLGFEDMNRKTGADNDFNDIVFYVTSNPVSAIENEKYPRVTNTETDTDKDGIADNFDDYPKDPERAFNNYYPAKDRFTTLAFEDLWPARGDYDMNDVTIDMQINEITNSSNKVVGISGKAVLKAMGGSYHNGFGIQWAVNPSLISKASGSRLSNGIIELADNGLENSESESVLILFDDGYEILKYTGALGSGVNTNPEAPYVEPDTIEFTIEFTEALSSSELGRAPYNPFIFVDQQREREVHLPDQVPTLKADLKLLGTSDDNSDPANGRYYKNSNNLPWAINITGGFDVPVEKKSIESAYTHFVAWSQSGGVLYPDWYLDNSGYRNTGNIYMKK